MKQIVVKMKQKTSSENKTKQVWVKMIISTQNKKKKSILGKKK